MVMSDRAAQLNKRLKGDRICTLIVMFVMLFVAVGQIVRFFSIGESSELGRSLQGLAGAVCMFLVYKLLKRIEETGKPFDDSTIKYLRAIAGILIITGLLSYGVAAGVDFIRNGTAEIEFHNIDLVIPIVGVNIGIISEIFVYGKELQEDNDLIA